LVGSIKKSIVNDHSMVLHPRYRHRQRRNLALRAAEKLDRARHFRWAYCRLSLSNWWSIGTGFANCAPAAKQWKRLISATRSALPLENMGARFLPFGLTIWRPFPSRRSWTATLSSTGGGWTM